MWVEPAAAIKFADQASKGVPKEWTDWFQGLLRMATAGRLNLFLIGCGGTGKSSLRKFLMNSDAREVPKDHEPTVVRRRDEAKGLEKFSRIHDYPGQTNDFLREFGRDARLFTDAPRNIVINCCAYGFHADWGRGPGLQGKPELLKLTTADMGHALADSREGEVAFLERFFELYIRGGFKGRLDMITLVLKQDLWIEEQNAVRQFYLDLYEAKIQSLYKPHVGAQFVHVSLPCCLRRENFTSKISNKEETKLTSAGFSTTAEEAYRTIFLHTLDTVVKRSL